MEKETAIIKFNGGRLAILCSKCTNIIKTGVDFTKEELELAIGGDKNKLPPQFCGKCSSGINEFPDNPA